MFHRPKQSEYHKFYSKYVDEVIDEDIFKYLSTQKNDLSKFLLSIPQDRINFAYAPGKWTIKQLVRHLSDSERVFGYRMLCIARKDKAKLPGFDSEEYLDDY